MIGEYPNCYARIIEQTCGSHKKGIYPDCDWLPCPDTYISKTGNFISNEIHHFQTKTFMTKCDSLSECLQNNKITANNEFSSIKTTVNIPVINHAKVRVH